jgi:hypothetical protein
MKVQEILFLIGVLAVVVILGFFIKESFEDLIVDCSTLKTCRECAGNKSCGWFHDISGASSKCMKRASDVSAGPEDLSNNMLNMKDETGAYMYYITNTSKCPVSTVEWPYKEPLPEWEVGDTRSSEMLRKTGDKEGEGEVGSGVVKKSYVSSPGTVRPSDSTSEKLPFPAAVELSSDSPFETYVAMLVRSELAGQGIPTREPFQLSDTVEAAGQYFNKVEKANASDM